MDEQQEVSLGELDADRSILIQEIMDSLSVKFDRLEKVERSIVVLAAIEAVAAFTAMECTDFAIKNGTGLGEVNNRADTYVAVMAANIKRALLEQFED